MVSSSVALFLAAGGSDPGNPLFNTNVITIVITSILVPFFLALMNKYGLRPPGQQGEETPSVESRDTPPEISSLSSKDDLLSMVPDMWKRLQDVERREDAWQIERQEIISQNKMLMKTNAILGKSLHAFFRWVEEGSNPPAPEVSEDLKDIVRLIVERVEQDEARLKE